jgi:ribosome-associated protein
VNTTDSRVELVFDLANSAVLGPFRRQRLMEVLASRLADGCLRVVAAEERSQWQNRQRAMARLADLLARRLEATASTAPGYASRTRCREATA